MSDTKFNFKKSIKNIKFIGSNRIRVDFESAEAANIFTEQQILKDNNFISYIPSFLTHKTGVIKGVDKSLDDTELKENIVSSHNISSVRRLLKRDINDPKKSFPLQTCLITFNTQTLPQYIYIYGTRCQVEPYVPNPTLCRNCLRYNHSTNQCRTKIQ